MVRRWFRPCRAGDGARDDFTCRQQILGPRVDQASAELREIEDARHQRDETGEIERNDAAGEAGEAEREEELPGTAQPVEWPRQPCTGGFSASAVSIASDDETSSAFRPVRLRSIKQWPKPAGCFDCVPQEAPWLAILPQTDGSVS